ncbi:TPA: transposase, partial [Clostridioides difficile]|nr:transposase [Clostridioides difficile]
IVESTNEITINNPFKELSTEELKRLAKLDDDG